MHSSRVLINGEKVDRQTKPQITDSFTKNLRLSPWGFPDALNKHADFY